MSFDLTQAGLILIVFALIGYIAGKSFELGYLGWVYKPVSGDLEKTLNYSSAGILITFLISIYILDNFNSIFLYFSLIFFPQIAQSQLLLDSSIVMYAIVIGSILLILLFSFVFGLLYSEIYLRLNAAIITTSDNKTLNIGEIYAENDEFLFYREENRNWGLIKKSLVNQISSIKKPLKIFKK